MTKVLKRILNWRLYGRAELINGWIGLTRFFLIMFYCVHLFACAWTRVGIANGDEGWIVARQDILNTEVTFWKYTTACYYIITTFSTVGYGDISGATSGEYIFAYCL